MFPQGSGNQCEQSGQALPTYGMLSAGGAPRPLKEKPAALESAPRAYKMQISRPFLLETDSGALAWSFGNSMGDPDTQLGLGLFI